MKQSILGLTLVTLLALMSMARAEVTENVSGGNVAALASAIRAANERIGVTTLLLSGTYNFGPADTLPEVIGEITIAVQGGGARFQARDGGPDQLLRISEAGSLSLTGLRIEHFTLSRIQQHDGPLIENRGRLHIANMAFEDLQGRIGGGFCCGQVQHEMIANWGELRIERTSFVDISNQLFTGGTLINHAGVATLNRVLTGSLDDASAVGIANLGGDLRIIGSTLGAREGAIFTAEGARTELVNTVITEESGRLQGAGISNACTGPIISLGHNLIADDSCELGGPEDTEGMPTGTFPLGFRTFGSRREPFIRLAGASPAVDSADPDFCGSFDLNGQRQIVDGDNDGIAVCDRGALELVQRQLSDGGANGLYFVPENDGHYITLLENANNTLLIWNTFDQHGNQAWVFGTGRLVNGRSLVVDAFRNLDGHMSSAGPVDTSLAHPWGSITLELDDCDGGRMVFDATEPGFGRGDFTFQRLASIEQLGCAD